MAAFGEQTDESEPLTPEASLDLPTTPLITCTTTAAIYRPTDRFATPTSFYSGIPTGDPQDPGLCPKCPWVDRPNITPQAQHPTEHDADPWPMATAVPWTSIGNNTLGLMPTQGSWYHRPWVTPMFYGMWLYFLLSAVILAMLVIRRRLDWRLNVSMHFLILFSPLLLRPCH